MMEYCIKLCNFLFYLFKYLKFDFNVLFFEGLRLKNIDVIKMHWHVVK
jgi:hypothetical protein